MERICANCKCWHRDGHDGICRPKAPEPLIIKINTITRGKIGEKDIKLEERAKDYTVVWGRTNDDDGCFHDFVPYNEDEIKPEDAKIDSIENELSIEEPVS